MQFFFIALFFINREIIAQDIHFSQFTVSNIYLNPSTAGMSVGGERAEINYRQQWSVMGSPYQTVRAGFDIPFLKNGMKKAYLGSGIDFFSDKAGDAGFGTTHASIAVAGILQLNEMNKISAGLSGGAAQRAADFSMLQWGNQYDGHYNPNMPSNEVNQLNSFIYADFGLGMDYEFCNEAGNLLGNDLFIINAGVALQHANKPLQKFYSNQVVRLHRKMVFHTASRYDFKASDFSILPALLFAYQKPASEFNIGTSLRYRFRYAAKITSSYMESAIYLGCFYRWHDAVIPQFIIEMGSFLFGFSYDLNVSSYKEVSKLNGGMEFSLKYTNIRGAKIKTK